MKPLTRILVIILFAISSFSTLSAQSYSKGVIEFGLVDLQMPGIDSTMLAMLRPNIEQKVGSCTIYFSNDSVAVVEGDTRTVLDVKTNTCYKFAKTASGVLKGFATYEGGLQTTLFQPTSLSSDSTLVIVLDTVLLRSHLDLPSRRYTVSSTNAPTQMIIETTNSIQVSGIEFIGNGNYDFPLTIEMDNMGPGMSIILGIKSIETSIPDPSVFSIDTIGMLNTTGLAPVLEEMLNDANDDE